MSERKEVKEVMRELRKKGFSVCISRSSHYVIRDERGRFIMCAPLTPSDCRWKKNFLSRLSRKLKEARQKPATGG